MSGKFIVVEGLEGAGKSSAIAAVTEFITMHFQVDPLCVREPGGTPMAEKIRHLLVNTSDETLCPDAELLMMYASRAQLLSQKIRPALEKKQWVISDRFSWSTYAYQGFGRDLGTEKVTLLDELVLSGLKPDLVLYLDVAPEEGLLRAKGRGALDRFEQEDMHFFHRVREGYLALVKSTAQAVLVDAMQPFDAVKEAIQSTLQRHFLVK